MKLSIMKIVGVFSVLLAASTSFAQGKTGDRHIISFTGIVLASSTTQGGAGPSGSTLLTHTEYVYNFKWIGLGLFTQYDMQGSAEKDSAYGPKIEFKFGPKFYAEVDYAMSAKRAYTERNIAEQTGDGIIVGVGYRFDLSKLLVFQASYKYRMLTIKKQDGVDLTQPIQQTDGYPAVGFGYGF